MEQDQLLRRDQPLIAGAGSQPALLIAAHGERQQHAANESVMRIVRAVAARGVVSAVAAGFVGGKPTVGEALDGLAARRIIVYPLFAANGYFTRDRLVQLIDEADRRDRVIEILPPLGLDPGLPDLIATRIGEVSRGLGIAPGRCSAILLAHGSRRNPASRDATERVAGEVRKRQACRQIGVAFLEQPPHLEEAVRSIEGPAIVVGMFSGNGLHGAQDAPRLIARLGRKDIAYAGVIGSSPGMDEIIVRSVQQALGRGGEPQGGLVASRECCKSGA